MPPFSFEKGFDISYLLRRVKQLRKVSDGKVSFVGLEYLHLLPIINSAVRSTADAGSLKPRCIDRALSDPSVTLDDPVAFIARCNDEIERLRSTPKQRLRVFLDVTYEGPRLGGTFSDADCVLAWAPSEKSSFMRRARSARSEALQRAKPHDKLQSPSGMTAIIADLDALNATDAYLRARDSVDKLRGIVNLFSNLGRGIKLFGGAYSEAINKLRLGPYQSVHDHTGAMPQNDLWYEPYWRHSNENVKFNGTALEVTKFIRRWWRRLRFNHLQEHVSDGLLRYCRALDGHDPDAALIGLWGALEALTGTQNAQFEVTVARVERLFPTEPMARQIAQHIRVRRNAHIHAARSIRAEEADVLLHQAEMLVERTLEFVLRFGNRFENTTELFHFMDHSLNNDVLARSKRTLDKSLRFRTSKSI